jgi:hypothetical protein
MGQTSHVLFLAVALALSIYLVASERTLSSESLTSEPIIPIDESQTPAEADESFLVFSVYIDAECRTAAFDTKFVADFSLCQSVTTAGSTSFLKLDCFANDTLHGEYCDSGCSSCDPFPQAISDTCTPYSIGPIIHAIKVNCNPPPPLDPPMTPNTEPLVAPMIPDSEPQTPPDFVPSSPDSASSQVYPISSLIVALVALLMFN